jgi:hypothetical protein
MKRAFRPLCKICDVVFFFFPNATAIGPGIPVKIGAIDQTKPDMYRMPTHPNQFSPTNQFETKHVKNHRFKPVWV